MLSARDFPGDLDKTNLLVMQETQVQCVAKENPLEKETASHFNILAWRIPWTEKPAGYSPWGHKELGMIE